MDNFKIQVKMPSDEHGMIGRECLKCKQYFKLKPGTGLETNHCNCPYCDYEGNSDNFWTEAQLEYAQSIAMQQAYDKFIKPSLNKLSNSFKQLERSTRNSLIQIKVKSTGNNSYFPIKYYSENELETVLICDNCKLEFAIYGVFSRCPDCNEINAFLIYEKSLEVIKKNLEVFSKPEIPKDILEISLSSILSSGIAAFDGLGKELRKRKLDKYPGKTRNLFQNISLLNNSLNNIIADKHKDYDKLLILFQVRHIYEHNMGVVDADFVNKLPQFSSMLNRKYKLNVKELNEFIEMMKELGEIIKINFEED